MKPFLDVTILMSSARYPTLFMILPIVDGLKDILQHAEGGLDGLRQIFLKQIEVRFGDVYADEELCVATLVDPRFKAILFATEDLRNRAIDWTVIAMTTVLESPAAGALQTAQSPSTAVLIPMKKPSIFDKLDRVKVANSPGAVRNDGQHSTAVLKQELMEYLNDDPLDRDCYPLQWWAKHQLR